MSDVFVWPEFLPAFAKLAEDKGFSATPLVEMKSGPIVVWEKPSANSQRVYISAGIHGDEPAGPLALLRLLEEDFFHDDIHWIVCPSLNPDGLAAGTRENGAGLDLNREYWNLGSLEVEAHSAWLKENPAPDLFISLHEDWETSGFYFYEINLLADDPLRARRIIESVKPWFEAEPGPLIDGHDSREAGWIYHAAEPDLPEGWPEAIFLAKHGCPLSYTFETPSRTFLSQRVAAHAAAVRTACECSLFPRREEA